jgi:transcriptional regulator with XRE-family HTH domain
VPLDRIQAAQLKQFGSNVKRERVARRMSQEKLAEAVELHPRTVQKIEAGETNILITTMLRIQKALKCSWEALLGKGK